MIIIIIIIIISTLPDPRSPNLFERVKSLSWPKRCSASFCLMTLLAIRVTNKMFSLRFAFVYELSRVPQVRRRFERLNVFLAASSLFRIT